MKRGLVDAPRLANHFSELMSLQWKIWFFGLQVVLFLSGAASAQSTMRGYTCAQVREAVVKYGGAQNAEALARAEGGTDREIISGQTVSDQTEAFSALVKRL